MLREKVLLRLSLCTLDMRFQRSLRLKLERFKCQIRPNVAHFDHPVKIVEVWKVQGGRQLRRSNR